ncbi:oxygenase MpaB family protein [Sphingomonas sp.]|uniref:oxygenase MpaB family protein n=1 Tax=Sphingomonas sp. TaxID=28214 RepID=UPI0035A8279A
MRDIGVVPPHVADMNPLRTLVESRIDALFAPADDDIPFDITSGSDNGLYGPGSVAWDVHGDFATMMIGGVAALLLQMLDRRAMAGVWDHSNFRTDMVGRLRRTARFVGGTTYAARDQAQVMIDRVRRIHSAVGGTLTDGTPYRADDPATLAWVHVAGEWCFLAAYQRYAEPGMSRARQDALFAETAVLAEALGSGPVPVTRRAADAYLMAMRPQLRADDRTRAVVKALDEAVPAGSASSPVQRVLMAAAVDLLPPWAAAMHGRQPGLAARALTRASAGALSASLRAGLAHRVARRNAALAARAARIAG